MIKFRGIVDDYISCYSDGPRKSYLDSSLVIMVSPTRSEGSQHGSTNFVAFFTFLITAVISGDGAGWAMLQHCREGGDTPTVERHKGGG